MPLDLIRAGTGYRSGELKGYEARGVPKAEALRWAWAAVNATAGTSQNGRGTGHDWPRRRPIGRGPPPPPGRPVGLGKEGRLTRNRKAAKS